jgi:hypothetical protein
MEIAGTDVQSNVIYLRLMILPGTGANPGMQAGFAYSTDGKFFTTFSTLFNILNIQGSWIGAKFGLFAIAPGASGKAGYADFDWINVSPPPPLPPAATKP